MSSIKLRALCGVMAILWIVVGILTMVSLKRVKHLEKVSKTWVETSGRVVSKERIYRQGALYYVGKLEFSLNGRVATTDSARVEAKRWREMFGTNDRVTLWVNPEKLTESEVLPNERLAEEREGFHAIRTGLIGLTVAFIGCIVWKWVTRTNITAEGDRSQQSTK